MIYRVLLSLVFLGLSLYAEPSMAQIQQAVSANPALLNTPQAKAAMAERGVTAAQVKQKLAESSVETANAEATTEVVENKIEDTTEKTQENESESIEDELLTNKRKDKLAKRVNPFTYKSNSQLRAELNAKQQRLTSESLSRYSLSFYTNKNKIDSSSLPTPDNYVVSMGDSLSVHVYGDREKNYNLTVKNDGTVELAFIGPVRVGGMTFKDVKEHLESKLKTHYKMSQFNITISKYSTIQVTLVGEVKNPGIYNLSSFSTPKDLLIAAKGVRNHASVREILIKRDSKTIATLDFYDLLFKGKKFGTLLLKQGDIIVIKKAKKLVAIDGYVSHAAIFELKGDEKLSQVISYAGGMKANASRYNIKIDRYSNNSTFETFKVTYKDAKKFKMKDGDKVYIYPLDFTAKSSVNFYGNIIRPGSYRLNNKKTLNEFFKKSLKNGLKSFFLPQTYFEYGVVKRYSDDLTYTTQSFNLSSVLSGEETVKLEANDQVYIFSQNDIFSNSYITTKGKTLVKSGKLQYVSGMTIQDAVNASGIDGVLDDKIRVTTYDTLNFMPKTSFYSLKEQGGYKLSPYDEVEVYDYYSKNILEPVTIRGEVVKPTTIYYENGMNFKDLLNIAGGFNKKAYTKSINIIRYYVDANQTRQQRVLSYDLESVYAVDIEIKPYDEVRVSKIIGWDSQDYDVVSIRGEVNSPVKVKYGKGMTLSDLLILAGGFNKKAYTKSLSITRYYVDDTQTRQQKVLNYNLDKVLLSEIKLEAYDEVKISKILGWDRQDFETVSIVGEVNKPLNTKFGKGMTLYDMVIMAGGVTKRAYNRNIEIVRYSIDENQTRQREILKINMENKQFSDITLKAYDEVRIFKIPNWGERASVTLGGEVMFPGVYIIENGEKLSSVIQRAGGFTKDAFVEGGVFTRESIRKNQQKQYRRSLAKIKKELAIFNAMPANAKKTAGVTQSGNALNEVMIDAEKYLPIGRVSLELDANLTLFEQGSYNLVLKDKDTLTIPSQIDTVTVFGEVFYATSFVHKDGLDADEYIELASGYAKAADIDNVYVIHADGTSEPIGGSWFSSSVEIQKGDTIVVPIEINEYDTLDVWDSVAKVMASFALTAAAINSLGII